MAPTVGLRGGIAALDVDNHENLPARAAAKGEIFKKENTGNRREVLRMLKKCCGRGLFIGIEVKGGDAMVFAADFWKMACWPMTAPVIQFVFHRR
jgi:acetylornithine/succinyldiaminopimelate/putrescine aminotransferase